MKSILNKNRNREKTKHHVKHKDIEDKPYNYILLIPHPYVEIHNSDDVDNPDIYIFHISKIDKLYAELITSHSGEYHITLFDPISARTYGIKRLITITDNCEILNGTSRLTLKELKELIVNS